MLVKADLLESSLNSEDVSQSGRPEMGLFICLRDAVLVAGAAGAAADGQLAGGVPAVAEVVAGVAAAGPADGAAAAQQVQELALFGQLLDLSKTFRVSQCATSTIAPTSLTIQLSSPAL